MEPRKKSKIVTVSINISDIKKNSSFFRLPENLKEPKEIRDHMLSVFKPSSGIMEGFVDGRQVVIQWYPDEVNEQADKLSRIASRLVKEKDFKQAAEILEKALSINKNDVEYLYKLGLIYFERKLYDQTILHLKTALQVCPIHFRANLLLGIALLKLRRFDAAEKQFIVSNIFNKSSVLPYLNLGTIYSIKKDYSKAIKMFNDCITLSPNESRAYLGLARIYTILKDSESANNNFRKVIELSPGSKIAELAKRSIKSSFNSSEETNLTNTAQKISVKKEEERISAGVHQFLSHNYSGSLDQFKSYLNKHPLDHFVWYLLGETQLRTGNFEGAVISFRKAINLYKKRGLYFKGIGISFYYLHKYRESADALKHAIQMGKRDPLCYTLLGVCNVYLKKEEESQLMFKNALQRNPNNPLALYFSAQHKIKHGNVKEAAIELKKILGFEYNIPIKENVKKLINSIQP